jgi:hypothetical protein
VPYRDRQSTGITLSVEIVDPNVRAWAMRAAASASAMVLPTTMMGLLSPLVAGGILAGSVVLGLAVDKAEPYLASSVWITVDERARAIRVERVDPGTRGTLIASVPIETDVHFVVTGAREGDGKLVEVVELRRGGELLVEVLRHPDDVFQSFLFARVEADIARINTTIQECVARAADRG